MNNLPTTTTNAVTTTTTTMTTKITIKITIDFRAMQLSWCYAAFYSHSLSTCVSVCHTLLCQNKSSHKIMRYSPSDCPIFLVFGDIRLIWKFGHIMQFWSYLVTITNNMCKRQLLLIAAAVFLMHQLSFSCWEDQPVLHSNMTGHTVYCWKNVNLKQDPDPFPINNHTKSLLFKHIHALLLWIRMRIKTFNLSHTWNSIKNLQTKISTVVSFYCTKGTISLLLFCMH